MDKEFQSSVGDALAAGSAIGDAKINGRAVVVPAGYKLESTETFQDLPMRARGTAVMLDAKSFAQYVKDLANASTRIYYRVDPPGFTAVFNDDIRNTGNWRDHQAVYSCPMSAEWKAWKEKSGTWMNQEDFAMFIHRNNLDCMLPEPAAMLEISRELTAKKKVNFASSIRLSDGSNQFTYEEEVSGTTQKGKLTVPELFTIAIPVLHGGDPYKIDCDFRYRIQDGGTLVMQYEIVRPHKILEAAFNDVHQQLAAVMEMSMVHGVPPKV